MPDMGWSNHIRGIEDSLDAECHGTAGSHGHTTEQAENCDTSEPLCPNCPWGKACGVCGKTLAEYLLHVGDNKYEKRYSCRWNSCYICVGCGHEVGSDEVVYTIWNDIFHIHCLVNLNGC